MDSKAVITHIVFIALYGAAIAAVELTPLKDIPQAKEGLLSAIAFLYGKIQFAGSDGVISKKLAKMSVSRRLDVLDAAGKAGSKQ